MTLQLQSIVCVCACERARPCVGGKRGGGGGACVRAYVYVSVSVCVYLGACRCDDLYVFLSASEHKVHIHLRNVLISIVSCLDLP